MPCVIFAILIILQWTRGESQGSYSLTYTYIFKITSLLCLIIKQILYQPIILLLYSPIWCNSTLVFGNSINIGFACLSSIHIALIVFSCLTIMLVTVLLVAHILFFSDEQPDSKLPWASCSILYEFYNLFCKLILSFCVYIINGNKTMGIFAGAFSLILSGMALYENFKLAIANDISIYCAIIVCEVSIFWYSVCLCVDFLLGINIANPILFIILVAIAIPLTILWILRNYSNIMSNSMIILCNNSMDVEIHCRVFLSKLGSKKNKDDNCIDGVLNYHCSICTVPSCPCRSILRKITAEANEDDLNCLEKKQDLSNTDQKVAKKDNTFNEKDSPEDDCVNNENEQTNIKNSYIQILISEIEQWITKNEGKAKLHLYLGCLKLFSFPSPLAALHEVLKAKEEQSDLYEQFHIHRML